MWLQVKSIFRVVFIAALGAMMMAGITACQDDQQGTPQMEQQEYEQKNTRSPEGQQGQQQKQQPAQKEGGDTGRY